MSRTNYANAVIWQKSSGRHLPYMYWRQCLSVGLMWWWCFWLWSRVYSLSIPGLSIRKSFRASSGIVSRKRSERYVEPYRGIDTSTTKNSHRVTLACIMITNERWKVLAGQSRQILTDLPSVCWFLHGRTLVRYVRSQWDARRTNAPAMLSGAP